MHVGSGDGCDPRNGWNAFSLSSSDREVRWKEWAAKTASVMQRGEQLRLARSVRAYQHDHRREANVGSGAAPPEPGQLGCGLRNRAGQAPPRLE